MLKWYKIIGTSEGGRRNVLKSLRKQRLMVREKDDYLIVCSSTNHQLWLSRVCQDFGATIAVLEAVPKGMRVPTREVYTTSCGEEFYDPILYSRHFRKCPKCKEALRTKKSEELTAKIEPGQEFNLDGVIASVEVVRDQIWERLEYLDSLLGNLKGYRDAKGKLSELTQESEKRIEAVRLLLRDNKL